MMEKINIAELLKDCPKGMELDCQMFENLYFDGIDEKQMHWYPIKCYTVQPGLRTSVKFSKFGEPNKISTAKCVIFPKGKTTWEGFQRPFKDGDILAYTSSHTTVFIYRNKENEPKYATSFYVGHTIGERYHNFYIYNKYTLIALNGDCDVRFATEEEKAKLFQAIKDNGYKWNTETKTLEKLIEPKFKVGDKVIAYIEGVLSTFTIQQIRNDNHKKIEYKLCSYWIDEDNLSLYKEVPNKFDITTLKPFDKVLVRDNDRQKWVISFFSHCNGLEFHKYSCINGAVYEQCIPYEKNERLLDTTNDCEEYYKTW